ncbi:MAG: hypothetical protein IPL25_16620 [Saprospiraceae bacterium]|nr:hypothetical protein [Candidatus Vicinibacter affinis]
MIKNNTQTEDIDSKFNMDPNDDNDVVIDGADDNEINEDGKMIHNKMRMTMIQQLLKYGI